MKKSTRILFLLIVLVASSIVVGQNDSIILFSELKYHSEFEKNAIDNFVHRGTDTMELFMSIDRAISVEEVSNAKTNYLSVLDQLAAKKLEKKKGNKKVKMAYTHVHDCFLSKYRDVIDFPEIFRTGNYNCVTASMIYAMVFDDVNIPFKVKASTNHVYLVANPGSKSTVIETTNPGFESQVFNGDFKRQYVSNLKTSKLISDSDYKNKSQEEIFEEHYKQVSDASFFNLAGFQYHNHAVEELKKNNVEEALTFAQKAYFFFPHEQVKALYLTALALYIDRCKFKEVDDADLIAQFARFENTNNETVAGVFENVIHKHMQYTNRKDLCDALHARLMMKIQDKDLHQEIDFAFNLQMAYHFQGKDEIERYILSAVTIKGNNADVKTMLDNYLNTKFYSISNGNTLLDTIANVEKRITLDVINPILYEQKLRAYLIKANEEYDIKMVTLGNDYLREFEKICETPLKSNNLVPYVEETYRRIVSYYQSINQLTKARSLKNRGLQFIPNSRVLQGMLNQPRYY